MPVTRTKLYRSIYAPAPHDAQALLPRPSGIWTTYIRAANRNAAVETLQAMGNQTRPGQIMDTHNPVLEDKFAAHLKSLEELDVTEVLYAERFNYTRLILGRLVDDVPVFSRIDNPGLNNRFLAVNLAAARA